MLAILGETKDRANRCRAEIEVKDFMVSIKRANKSILDVHERTEQ